MTSTSQDETLDLETSKAKFGRIIILPQHPSSLSSSVPSVWKGDNNIYTLTLTDGSIVQLRVQNDVIHQQQRPVTNTTSQDDLTNLETCCWFQNDSDAACTHCDGRQQVVSPLPDVVEEVILPLTSHTSSSHLKPELLFCQPSLSLSPVSPQEVMPMYAFTKTRPTTPKSTLFNTEDTNDQVKKNQASKNLGLDKSKSLFNS